MEAVGWRLRRIARGNTPLGRLLRWGWRALRGFSVPAPRPVVVLLLGVFVAIRGLYYFFVRILICEPLFKAYCTSYGKNLHTGVFVHWVQGRGNLIVGDDVLIDGKVSFSFASLLQERPRLVIGSGTGIGHGCTFVVAREIIIGANCRIATGVRLFDSPGHPLDAAARRAGESPAPSELRAIRVEDDVWIGTDAIVFPGVTIHRGSIVSAGAVVTSDVSAYSLVAGNPARRIASLSSTEDVSSR